MQLKIFADKTMKSTFPEGFQIESDIKRQGSSVQCQFDIQGATDAVKDLASFKTFSERCDELWKSTCFEWFVKPLDQDFYWEFNLGPRGAWNVYRLSGYRSGLRPETRVRMISASGEVHPGHFLIQATVDFSGVPEFLQAAGFTAQTTVVLQNTSGQNSYWAPLHTQPQPDFHHPNHFVLSLQGETP